MVLTLARPPEWSENVSVVLRATRKSGTNLATPQRSTGLATACLRSDMKTLESRWRALTAVFSLIALLVCSGCRSFSPAHLAGNSIRGTGSLAEKATITTIKTAGSVTASTAKVLVQTSGSALTSLAKASFVTFKDTATGISRQIPYSEGLRLYAASQSAKIQGGLEAFQLLRNGALVMSANWSSVKSRTANDPVLKPGDVIHLSRGGRGKSKSPRTS